MALDPFHDIPAPVSPGRRHDHARIEDRVGSRSALSVDRHQSFHLDVQRETPSVARTDVPTPFSGLALAEVSNARGLGIDFEVRPHESGLHAPGELDSLPADRHPGPPEGGQGTSRLGGRRRGWREPDDHQPGLVKPHGIGHRVTDASQGQPWNQAVHRLRLVATVARTGRSRVRVVQRSPPATEGDRQEQRHTRGSVHRIPNEGGGVSKGSGIFTFRQWRESANNSLGAPVGEWGAGRGGAAVRRRDVSVGPVSP